MMSVPVQSSPSFSAGTPTKLFEGAYVNGLSGRPYDVSRDGQKCLMIKQSQSSADQTTSPSMVVVVNWTKELKARLPLK